MRSKTLIAAMAVASFGLASVAFAQDQTPPQPPPQEWDEPAPAPAPAEMTDESLKAALEQMGYTDVKNVDRGGGQWRVDATNGTGQKVTVVIDPATSTIVAEEPRED